MYAKLTGFAIAVVLAAPIVTATEQKQETKKVEMKERTKTVKHSTASDDQAALQKEAKISMDQARQIAMKRVPGAKIESGELEREHGKLIYSFDMKTSKPGVTEVNIDAMTGKIVAVQIENAAKEAAEKKQEAKEKKAAASKH